jgi:hypothetical protein
MRVTSTVLTPIERQLLEAMAKLEGRTLSKMVAICITNEAARRKIRAGGEAAEWHAAAEVENE